MMRSCLLLLLAVSPLAIAGGYGEPVPLGRPLPLAEALAQEPLVEGRVLISGRVTEVCKKKGCWAMLEDNGQAARLTMHEYSFFLPPAYRGRTVVWGELQRFEMTPEVAKHLAEDGGRSEPDALVEYRIVARGVSLLDEDDGHGG